MKIKYAINDICPAGKIVGLPINSRYLVECLKCKTVRRVQASHARCMNCYKNKELKYEVGKKTPDGVTIYDVDRSKKTGIKLLVRCSTCNNKVWKWLSSVSLPCKPCKSYEESLKLTSKKIVIKIGSYRSSAKKRGYEWSLSHDQAEYLFLDNCKYCGISGKYEHNGIDRIENEIGYTFSNCVSCCAICNYSKGSKTIENWYIWLDRITLFRTKS